MSPRLFLLVNSLRYRRLQRQIEVVLYRYRVEGGLR